MGRSQAVRQRILIPPFGGSIPPAPARSSASPEIAHETGLTGALLHSAATHPCGTSVARKWLPTSFAAEPSAIGGIRLPRSPNKHTGLRAAERPGVSPRDTSCSSRTFFLSAAIRPWVIVSARSSGRSSRPTLRRKGSRRSRRAPSFRSATEKEAADQRGSCGLGHDSESETTEHDCEPHEFETLFEFIMKLVARGRATPTAKPRAQTSAMTA